MNLIYYRKYFLVFVLILVLFVNTVSASTFNLRVLPEPTVSDSGRMVFDNLGWCDLIRYQTSFGYTSAEIQFEPGYHWINITRNGYEPVNMLVYLQNDDQIINLNMIPLQNESMQFGFSGFIFDIFNKIMGLYGF